MFENFKIPPEVIEQRLGDMRAGFATSGRPGAFEANAVRVIAERLARRPRQYLEFGPYWWAVKQVLIEAGYHFGARGDALLASEYRGAGPVETLVAAETFKDFYRATYFEGNNRFDIAGDGQDYVLRDADMEELAATAA